MSLFLLMIYLELLLFDKIKVLNSLLQIQKIMKYFTSFWIFRSFNVFKFFFVLLFSSPTSSMLLIINEDDFDFDLLFDLPPYRSVYKSKEILVNWIIYSSRKFNESQVISFWKVFNRILQSFVPFNCCIKHFPELWNFN